MTKTILPFIVFEVTSECNINCLYCYNHWKREGEIYQKYNSYKLAKTTLNKIFKQAEISHITFSGGEPFVSERFVELVLFTRLQNKSVSIISNGTACKMSDIKHLNQFKISVFELPIHSYSAEIHDKMANCTGAWEKSIETIKNIQTLGGNIVPVIIITAINYQEIDKTITFINNLGLNTIMLNRFNIGGNGIANKTKLELSKIQLNETFTKVNNNAQELKLRISSNVCTPHCVVNPADYPYINFTNCTADPTKRPLTINALGDVRFCNHSPVILGNIYKTSIAEIIKTEQSSKWMRIIPDFCKECQSYPKCNAGCRAASEQIGKQLNYADPIIQNQNTNL